MDAPTHVVIRAVGADDKVLRANTEGKITGLKAVGYMFELIVH